MSKTNAVVSSALAECLEAGMKALPSAKNSFLLVIPGKKYGIFITVGSDVVLGIAFEQRPGVWHLLGNFIKECDAFCKKHGIEQSSVRTDTSGKILNIRTGRATTNGFGLILGKYIQAVS